MKNSIFNKTSKVNLKTVTLVLNFLLIALGSIGANADASIPTPESLVGTGWEGTFTALGITKPIRIGFLQNLSAKGEVLYFHAVRSPLQPSEISLLGTDIISMLDTACPITPRALLLRGQNPSALQPQDPNSMAQIFTFPCLPPENPESVETFLETRKDRVYDHHINVTKILIDEENGKRKLTILAKIGPIKVTYYLNEKTEQEAPQDTNDLKSLRYWAVSAP